MGSKKVKVLVASAGAVALASAGAVAVVVKKKKATDKVNEDFEFEVQETKPMDGCKCDCSGDCSGDCKCHKETELDSEIKTVEDTFADDYTDEDYDSFDDYTDEDYDSFDGLSDGIDFESGLPEDDESHIVKLLRKVGVKDEDVLTNLDVTVASLEHTTGVLAEKSKEAFIKSLKSIINKLEQEEK